MPPSRPVRVASLALALGVGMAAVCRAERPPLKAYTTADGLPHDSINKIVRDSRGFLWFCTADGLSRFDGYRFKNYTQDQGLPHRNVNDILETRSGAYLVATSAGLSVLDPLGTPYRWNVRDARLEQTSDAPPLFRTFVPAATLSERSRQILALAEDGSGRIWAATARGLFRMEPVGRGWTFTPFEFAPPGPVEIPGLLADDAGGLLVASSSGAFRIAPAGHVSQITADPAGSIFQDRQRRLWLDQALSLKVYAWDDVAPRLLYAFTQKDGLPPNAIHFSTRQTADGRIYTGFEYGFGEVLLDAAPGTPKVRVFEREKINAFADDAGGALWIGTDTKGAWKLARTGFTMFGPEDGLSPTDELMSVFPDREGGVYLVSRPNKLSHLRGGRLDSVLPSGLTSRSWGWHFLDLLSRDGEWWIPGIDGLRRYPRVARFADLARTPPRHVFTTADGLYTSEAFSAFEDSRGDIWFSVIGAIVNPTVRWDRQTNRVVRYGVGDGLPAGNGPIAFAEDTHDSVWLGFYFGGLARYRNGRFRLFGPGDGLPQAQVSDLLIDPRGRLWIATSGAGLYVVDDTNAETPVFRSLTMADGLSSNQAICLAQDHSSRVYVGTGRGINRIDGDGRVNVFTVEDGLPSNQVTRCAADTAGALWFVTRNTLLRFVPGVERPQAPPPVLIDRVLVNGRAQPLPELGSVESAPLDLPADQHQIEVGFFALTAVGGENVRYQYRFDDEAWSAPTRQRALNFDLSPGRRTLAIRAIDSQGRASARPATLVLGIRPPLWSRPWFIVLAAAVSLALLSAVYRYRTARLREVNAALAEARQAEQALSRTRAERLGELERVRARIATDLHDDIGSSLTQIAMLGEVAQRQATAEGVQALQPIARVIDISNELVDTMSDIVWAITPSKDHLSDLVQRMRRFASDVLAARGISFRFEAPDADHDIALGANVRREVFLIFKETLKNVVQHAACTQVEILFRVERDALVMTVIDNGRGFEPDATTAAEATRGGNGLPSLRRRAREMSGTFDVISRPGDGTTTRLRLGLGHPPEGA
jgi:signal transduction histidine kinase/ligand-binding sensor domain-containing protein